MDVANLILSLFQGNYWVLTQQAEGLSHADSLLQPPFPGNCLNWTVGHILGNRNRALALLGQPAVWPAESAARYARGSQPIVAAGEAEPFETLMAQLAASQAALEAALESVSAETLATPTSSGRSLAEQLHGLGWHETYHAGQTELLRKLAGKNDQIIP
jgi:hypothetical protein